MFEPPPDFENMGDSRPVWVYVFVLGVLWSLPWLGVECFFGWCVVQTNGWWAYAALMALPFLLFLEFPLRVIDKMRGVDDEHD